MNYIFFVKFFVYTGLFIGIVGVLLLVLSVVLWDLNKVPDKVEDGMFYRGLTLVFACLILMSIGIFISFIY